MAVGLFGDVHFHESTQPSTTLQPNPHSTSPNTASEAIQLGLVGLLTRPVIQAAFSLEKEVTTSDQPVDNKPAEESTPSTSAPVPAATESAASQKTTPSVPVLLSATTVPALGGSINHTLTPVPAQQSPAEPTSVEQAPTFQSPTPITTEQAYLPQLYTKEGTHPITMAAVATQPEHTHHFGVNHANPVEDNDYALAEKAQNLDLNDRPSSRATHRTNKTTQSHVPNGALGAGNLTANENYHDVSPPSQYTDNPMDHRESEETGLGNALSSDPTNLTREVDQEGEYNERPGFNQRASRSYVKPIPIVTTYEPDLPEQASVRQRKSVAGSTKAPSVKRASSKAGSIRSNKAATVNGDHHNRPPSVAGDHHHGNYTVVENYPRPPSVTGNRQSRPPSVNGNHARQASVEEDRHTRPPSVNGDHHDLHVRSPSVASVRRLPQLNENDHGFAPGQVASPQRQHELQGGNGNRVSLQDSGPMSRDRSTTFEEPDQHQRAASPTRPHSAFGYRPQPNLMSISEGDRPESRNDQQRDLRAGMLSRSGTTMSRAGTLGRNGTLSRGANGGTIGNRKGAFGRGAGASVGTQPEEVLGRDDIHMRAELSERILDATTLRKLSTMEKKDAARLSKVIKAEGKAEAKAVAGSIRELERLTKLQREAAAAERKSQLRLSKYTRKEHKARLRFLKEKEKYEKIEGELRNCENDFEERRDHASGLTSQVAELTQSVDDQRAMKAADDREREVKLLALKNPAHS